MAAEGGHADAVAALVEAGAELNRQDKTVSATSVLLLKVCAFHNFLDMFYQNVK